MSWLLFDLFKDGEQIAASVDDALDPDSILANPEKNDVLADWNQSGIDTKLRSEPIEQRLFGNVAEARPQHPNPIGGVAGAVLRDVLRDLRKIVLH